MPGPRPIPAYDRVMRRSIESMVFSHGGEHCVSCFLATAGDGYPVVSRDDGRQTTAARVVWEHSRGAVPDGLVVCHMCNNPMCVNINHMFLGTHAERSKLKVRLGRARGNEKLTRSQAGQILRRVQGGERLTDLAAEYGVTTKSIANIKHGRSWKSLARQLHGNDSSPQENNK